MTKIRKLPLNLHPQGTPVEIGSWLNYVNTCLKFVSYRAQYAQDTGDTYISKGKDFAYFVRSDESSEEEWQYLLRYVKWFNERLYPQFKESQGKNLNVPR